MAKRGGGVSAVGLRPPCKTQPPRSHPDCRATLNLFVAQRWLEPEPSRDVHGVYGLALFGINPG